MDLKNYNGNELRNFFLYNHIEAFFENFHQKWKMHHAELNSDTSKSSK